MYRLLGIPAAALVIVGAPQLIALQGNTSPQPAAAVAQPAPSTPPPPPSAALTVRLSGHAGMSGDPTLLRILAYGDEPKSAPVSRLAAADGLDTATVTPEPIADCAKAKIRATSAGTKEWCLSLEGVGAGHDLTGVIKGGTTLTLTVSRRHSFWPWPFWVLVGGLLTGAAAVIVPTFLQTDVRNVLLDRLLARNRRANAGQRINGLDAWVSDQRERMSVADLLALVGPVVRAGPADEQAAREKLRAAVSKGDALGKDSAFVGAARKIASAPNDVSDFLDTNGKRTTSYPADDWLEAFNKQMKPDQGKLDVAQATISKLPDPPRAKRMAELALLRTKFAAIEKLDQIAEFEKQLDLLQSEIEKDELDAAPAAPTMTALSDEVTNPELARLFGADIHLNGTRRPPELKGGRLTLATVGAGLFTCVTCLAVVGFAAVTVEQTNYAPNVDFASFTDYFKLFSAALTSTAAAAVLGFVRYWRPDPSTTGEAPEPSAGKKKA